MDASRRPLGVTREAVWVAQTPMGEMGIVLIEGENVAEANRRFAASTSASRSQRCPKPLYDNRA
jgi:hypothetical protein